MDTFVNMDCLRWLVHFRLAFRSAIGEDFKIESKRFMTQRMVSFFGFFVLAMTGGATATAQNQEEGKKIYVAYCTGCHGEKGKGNGTAAQSLPVRLADHTNGVAMNQLSDKFLIDVISKSGGAMGKSSFMPAWGSSLNERQIRDIAAYLRTIAYPHYRPDPYKK